MTLTPTQLDRACGAVLGSAVGDALGAPYEFDRATVGSDGPQMIGGGLGDFAPGEWTDDTSMAWAVLDVAASGVDLRSDEGLTAVGRRFRAWYDTSPPDIGNQTRSVLGAVGADPTGEQLTAVARELHERTGHTGGNGSLMRTAAVALPYLTDPAAVVDAARRVSALTHYDPRAQEACVLWSLAIRRAVVDAELDLRAGLAFLDDEAAAYWTEQIDEAESCEPAVFMPNGWVVTALQAAWSAIVHTPVPATDPCRHFGAALDTAIRIGNDTDTVAAIAGALLGARWGASGIPARWRRILHGYPGLTGEQLVHLAHVAANGSPGRYGWPTVARIDYSDQAPGILVRHPHDDGVWLGDASALDALPDEVSAVVSLCLVGSEQVPAGVEHVPFRLIDEASPEINPNLSFLLGDAAETVASLRSEGHEVLVHCVAAQSRTPAVAVAYALRLGVGVDEAFDAVGGVIPGSGPNAGFAEALGQLA
ncbi:ADP-ribosylglycohydrolase family protein [Gordonia iterans]